MMNELENTIKREKACSSSTLRWINPMNSNNNQNGNSLGIVDCEFNSSKGTNYVKFICLKAYTALQDYYKHAIELEDNNHNKYFLFIGFQDESSSKDLGIEKSKPYNIYIPIFEIQEKHKENTGKTKENYIFFHVGYDGIKTARKKVYQDIDTYLELNNFPYVNRNEETIINSKFHFLLARESVLDPFNKKYRYDKHFEGTCCNPTLEQVKRSIIKQFVQSFCFEKLIFSCRQVKKSFLFTNFFVIIDQTFLTDTFNYWQDKSKDIGIETDYKVLVGRNGVPFEAAQQFLIDPNYSVELFIQSSLEDQEQYEEDEKKSNLYLNFLNANLISSSNSRRHLNEEQEKIIFSVFCLYGLLHAKYILTPPGQAKMLELYVYNSFPKCPRSKCNGIRCLPYGITEKPGQNVKMYCPKCETIYNYDKNKLDGAFFGPTYVHLLMRKFPQLKEFEKSENDQAQNENKFSMFGIPLLSKELEQKIKTIEKIKIQSDDNNNNNE